MKSLERSQLKNWSEYLRSARQRPFFTGMLFDGKTIAWTNHDPIHQWRHSLFRFLERTLALGQSEILLSFEGLTTVKEKFPFVKKADKRRSCWRPHLEYLRVESERNQETAAVEVLYERCMIACALYEEFWLKYVDWLEGLKAKVASESPDNVEQVWQLVYCVFPPSLRWQSGSYILVWAREDFVWVFQGHSRLCKTIVIRGPYRTLSNRGKIWRRRYVTFSPGRASITSLQRSTSTWNGRLSKKDKATSIRRQKFWRT